MEKKVFYFNADPMKPITAAGILFYKNHMNQMYCLIQEQNNKYEDIGGKIDTIDQTLEDTICRELEEETNHRINATNVRQRLNGAKKIYIPICKYCLYIVEADQNEADLKKNDFGEEEKYNNKNRTIGWIKRDELSMPHIIKYKLNWRLRSKTLFEYLKETEHNMKFKKKLFNSI